MSEDMLSPEEMMTAAPASEDTVWPATPAARGQIYGIVDTRGDKMVAMSLETWTDFGTLLEISRRNAREVAAAAKKMQDQIQSQHEQLSDLQSRHEALRDQLRKSRRANLEGVSVASTADIAAITQSRTKR